MTNIFSLVMLLCIFFILGRLYVCTSSTVYYIMQIMLSACADVALTSVFVMVELYYQMHIFHLAFMLCTGGNNVNPCGVDV